MSDLYNVKVLQVAAKSLLFRKCAKCSAQVIFAVQNAGLDDIGICKNCNCIIKDYNTNYKLSFTAVNTDTQQILDFVAYDQAVEMIIGCTASDFSKHLEIDHDLIKKLEDEMKGLYVYVVVDVKKKNNAKTTSILKVKSAKVDYTNNVKLIDVITKDWDTDLKFDEFEELFCHS